LTYIDSAAGIIAASMKAGNLRLTAKRGKVVSRAGIEPATLCLKV